MDYVLVDQSTTVGNAPEYGGPIAAAQLADMAAALEMQLNRDFAFCWSGSYRVRAASNSTDIQPGEIACVLADSLPEDGAVAYHDVTGADVPFVMLGRNMCTSVMADGHSVSAAMSHELCEAAGDRACNRWATDNVGFEWPIEACDAVEANWYAISGVALSDFLLQAFFENGATGPLSFMGTPEFAALVGAGLASSGSFAAAPAPFTCAPGGYQVQRTVGTGETQVWGKEAMHPGRLLKARHPLSRVFRRGGRV